LVPEFDHEPPQVWFSGSCINVNGLSYDGSRGGERQLPCGRVGI
jgi:hypothetical protein